MSTTDLAFDPDHKGRLVIVDSQGGAFLEAETPFAGVQMYSYP